MGTQKKRKTHSTNKRYSLSWSSKGLIIIRHFLLFAGLLFIYDASKRKEAFVAYVPDTLMKKIEDGDLNFIRNDIATVDVKVIPFLYDFVSCINVLYLLSMQGQQLALRNISECMNLGGLLYLNSRSVEITDEIRKGLYTGMPLFTEQDGWLTDGLLHELGFEFVERTGENSNGYMCSIEKSYFLSIDF